MSSTTVLYAVWSLLPLGFLAMALWSYLERLSGKAQLQDNASLLKQFLFVFACVVVSIALDHFTLKWLADDLLGGQIPLGVFQVALLPVVLLIGAKIVGPSAAIRISKAPHFSDRPARTKPRRGSKS